MKQFTITHNNGTKRSPNMSTYVFEVVGDLDQPGALRVISRNGHACCMNQVSGSAYRAAIAHAKTMQS